MEGMIALLVLAVLAVPVLLVIALVSISGLKQRVAALEQQVTALNRRAVATPAATATLTEPALADLMRQPAPPTSQPAPAPPSPVQDVPVAPAVREPAPPAPQVGEPTPAMPAPALAIAPVPRQIPRPPPATPSKPGIATIAMRAVQRWFTVGNVPVKIGMLVLLAGVASLLKYGADQGWFTMPPELRLAGVAAAALAALVFAWRKRDSNRVFALSLQGGAIGVLLLVVFAAFKNFGMLPAGAAFAISIVLVAGAGVLAVLQDAKALAVFALLAGFLAPIWLSTGSGNHVALFSYYAVLNAAIVGIAWYKAWRILNLLGFAFSFGITTAWGVFDYSPQKYASTQPFLALFFAMYLLIPILFARRRPPGRRDLIDGCLVFGMPLVAFSLQAGLLEGRRMALAFCALGLGALYAGLSWWLRRRKGFDVLAQSHALLAVGFATLAVPLALSAQATACVFALEGAALCWLGLRQQRLLPQLAGAGLQLAAAVAFTIGLTAARFSPGEEIAVPIANAAFMGALLIAIAGFASAWAYRAAKNDNIAGLYYAWGLAWWVGNALNEIVSFLGHRDEPDALLAFAALTGWLAAEVHRRRPASALALTGLAALASAVPLALWQSGAHEQPFAGNGVWAWLVYAILGIRSLQCLRDGEHRLASAAQFTWWLVWPLVASLLLGWLPGQFAGMGDGWQAALIVLPWLLVAALALYRWRWLSMPLGDAFDGWRGRLLSVLFVVLGLWWLVSLFIAGAAAPLPWLPVLNPMELAQLAVLVLALRWQVPMGGRLSSSRIVLLSALAFAWITSVVLHAVHHWGGIAWDGGLLSASLAQTSLTVVWSVLGVLGWVIGSRRGQRMLWLAGAVLMGVVLAKLVLVDRQHLGNLLGIGSFIAYGLLCTVVGYVAPAPPRGIDANPDADIGAKETAA
ncbi:DUF2339 domain-containing protein [Thermomonas carbonis]|uniref:DUF2339 domain-containing protein n=1 Tax=Thermomonas carbonis TaxID=1463158 RepID=A0A7G9SRH4_9GAMM|nr:DUF2339 domain-containing protein [Thermomonas carbonis]QNN70449.1 DUF2339 domain-containing protein [Thermomonas carbonis]GHC00082.1 membrane protein [Thermomonas carbonis]